MARRFSIQGVLKGLVLAVAIAALGAGTYYVYLVNFPAKKQTGVQLTDEERASGENSEEYHVRVAREEATKAEWLGLNTFYQWESFIPEFHALLYHQRDFKQVTALLNKHRDNTSTPLERYRYSELVGFLHHNHGDHVADEILETLTQWAGLSPGNYYPLIARANHYMDQVNDLRDGRYASQIPPTDLEKMDKLGQRAWDDLIAAKVLGPNDPEIFATLVRAAGVCGQGPGVMRKYYEVTLALCPHHIDVRLDMLYFLQPQWYGSHEEMKKVVEESAGARREFPYLFVLERAADSLFEPRLARDSEETMRKGADAFRKQAEISPDDKTVLGKAAWFAYKAGDLTQATEFFERLGTTFPTYSGFDNVYQFHTARMESFRATSASSDVAGTPREKVLLDLALTAEPTNGPLSSLYLTYLVRTRDIDQIRSFFARVKDPYIMTGALGEPPDLNYVEALALANGLFWSTGVHGAEEERAVLDRAMELAPDNAFVHLLYAEHYSAQEKYRKARTYLERAREIDPAYLPALHSMAWLTYHQRRWDEGVALAKELLASGDSYYVTVNTKDANEIIALCEKKKAREAAESWGSWLARKVSLK